MSYVVVAAGASTVLEFASHNDPGAFALDDVSVVPIPLPSFQSIRQSSGTVNFTWTTMAGLAYQIQYKTNLTSANWINLGGPTNATSGTMSASDSHRLRLATILPHRVGALETARDSLSSFRRWHPARAGRPAPAQAFRRQDPGAVWELGFPMSDWE